MTPKVIAFDFDGTLHPYENGWCGSVPDDVPPIPGTKETLEKLKADGYRLVIFSCRADHREGLDGIWEWLVKYQLEHLIHDVTGAKPKATVYVDDRAVSFKPRTHGPHVAWELVMADILRISEYEGHGSAQ